jgi:hypothetical protein
MNALPTAIHGRAPPRAGVLGGLKGRQPKVFMIFLRKIARHNHHSSDIDQTAHPKTSVPGRHARRLTRGRRSELGFLTELNTRSENANQATMH